MIKFDGELFDGYPLKFITATGIHRIYPCGVKLKLRCKVNSEFKEHFLKPRNTNDEPISAAPLRTTGFVI